MSQPKQYSPALEPGRGSNFNGLEVSMREDLAGKWVLHSDYAALAAENERLRRAGDEVAKKLVQHCAPWQFAGVIKFKGQEVIAAWLAAKEGGRK